MIYDILPVNNYCGNNSTTTFDFDFYIDNEEQLKVTLFNENSVQMPLVLNVDYSINEIKNPNGSFITFPLAGSSYGILTDEQKISIELSLPISQETQSPVMSLDDLKARLADAEEKLKANEKELKQCKKDYVPLNKVWRTYEKDFKKLQRKEALVAKQQVVLYGVNNYADIDEEKAKKLAEDLDLLDGLKLSVQHCEEVMAKNEDRYPLLKRMYEVLKRQNTDLKDEIKYLQEQIAELESQVEGE